MVQTAPPPCARCRPAARRPGAHHVAEEPARPRRLPSASAGSRGPLPAQCPICAFTVPRPSKIQGPGSDFRPAMQSTPSTFLPSKQMAHSNTNTVPREFFFFLLPTWQLSDAFFILNNLIGLGRQALSRVHYCGRRAALRCLWRKETVKEQNMKVSLETSSKPQELCAGSVA